MSYSIYIGEAKILRPTDEDVKKYGETQLDVTVEHVTLPDAPTFPGDTMTGNGNGRHPGYSQWDEFTRDVGLYEVFFSRETGLIVPHPGTHMLTKDHFKAFQEAETRWVKKHSGRAGWTPGWDPNDDPFSKTPSDPRYDGNAARLTWLRWWTGWALANCTLPAMSNS